jgi:hypothetical protein
MAAQCPAIVVQGPDLKLKECHVNSVLVAISLAECMIA